MKNKEHTHKKNHIYIKFIVTWRKNLVAQKTKNCTKKKWCQKLSKNVVGRMQVASRSNNVLLIVNEPYLCTMLIQNECVKNKKKPNLGIKARALQQNQWRRNKRMEMRVSLLQALLKSEQWVQGFYYEKIMFVAISLSSYNLVLLDTF